MEKKSNDVESSQCEFTSGPQTLTWVAPLQSLKSYSIAEFTQMAARYSPWDSNCFPQAIVASFLLGIYRIPYAMYFGLMRNPSAPSLSAHAWVVAGRVDVTGGSSFSRFTVVGKFLSPLMRGRKAGGSSASKTI